MLVKYINKTAHKGVKIHILDQAAAQPDTIHEIRAARYERQETINMQNEPNYRFLPKNKGEIFL